ARQLSEREGGGKDFVISQQQAKIEELRWELERRAREEERLRQDRAEDAGQKRMPRHPGGFAPPLPGQRSGRRPASAGKARSGPRGWSASPRASPVKGFTRGRARCPCRRRTRTGSLPRAAQARWGRARGTACRT
ncbi:unnamed protein product, partial [Prorocentrum cordatum]